VSALRESGVDAHVCAQEHSEVPTLWNHVHPDLVVFLEVDLATIRKRRSPTWPEAIFQDQQRRLLNARETADVIINSDVTGVDQAVALVRESLDRARTTKSR
jgi:hypothetical protein